MMRSVSLWTRLALHAGLAARLKTQLRVSPVPFNLYRAEFEPEATPTPQKLETTLL